MTIFAVVALVVLTFVFIVYPLFRRRSPEVGLTEDEKLQELRSKRDTTYSMLKEMEFDLQSGILTEEDYHDLEARYKRKAISILRGIDDLKRGTNMGDEIEKRVLELRRSKGRFCSQCGTRYQDGDRFCPRCGTSLSRGEQAD